MAFGGGDGVIFGRKLTHAIARASKRRECEYESHRHGSSCRSPVKSLDRRYAMGAVSSILLNGSRPAAGRHPSRGDDPPQDDWFYEWPVVSFMDFLTLLPVFWRDLCASLAVEWTSALAARPTCLIEPLTSRATLFRPPGLWFGS